MVGWRKRRHSHGLLLDGRHARCAAYGRRHPAGTAAAVDGAAAPRDVEMGRYEKAVAHDGRGGEVILAVGARLGDWAWIRAAGCHSRRRCESWPQNGCGTSTRLEGELLQTPPSGTQRPPHLLAPLPLVRLLCGRARVPVATADRALGRLVHVDRAVS